MIAGYLTTTEAANLLNVTPGRIRQLAIDGRLQSLKIGAATLLVRQTSVERYKQSRKRTKSNGNGHK